MKPIARVYDTYGQARQVVADLEAAGAGSSDVDIIANRHVCEESVRPLAPSPPRVLRLMDQHRPIDCVAREADYRKTGGKSFDPKAAPLYAESGRDRAPALALYELDQNASPFKWGGIAFRGL